MLKFEIRPLPPSPNVRERLFWTARRRLNSDFAWRVLKGVQLDERRPSRPTYAKVTLHAARFAIQMMDRDNFIGSLKPVIDGLVACKVIPDDNPSVVWFGKMEQVRVRSKKEERLEVRIEEKE